MALAEGMTAATPAGVDPKRRRRRMLRRCFMLAGLGYIVFWLLYQAILHEAPPLALRLGPVSVIIAGIIASQPRGRGRMLLFLVDWVVQFLLLVPLWLITSKLTALLNRPVYVSELVDIEQAMFGGQLPTVWLQDRLASPDKTGWYDWVATLHWGLHFIILIPIGTYLWLQSRRKYWRFGLAATLVFALGYVLYVVVPAAPPWMAARDGFAPELRRLTFEALLGRPTSAFWHEGLGPNETAAMPSLHAALPLMIALVMIQLWGRRAAWALAYPLLLGFNLVYLGEHYVIDVLVGYVVGAAAFVAMYPLGDRIIARRRGTEAVTRAGIPCEDTAPEQGSIAAD